MGDRPGHAAGPSFDQVVGNGDEKKMILKNT
jgi:hypothetical protein